MRETVSTTWTFQLIIIFILIFACFLTLVISYSKAYSIKNSVITIVEKYEGITPTSRDIISNYLDNSGYRTMGSCTKKEKDTRTWYGITADNQFEDVVDNKKYLYCVAETKVYNENNQNEFKVYNELKFFYKFNLPFLGELKTFVVNGRTSVFFGNDTRDTNKEDV
ncbi:MAG: hypothetical protein RSF02_01180 [Bacilli bacterium]